MPKSSAIGNKMSNGKSVPIYGLIGPLNFSGDRSRDLKERTAKTSNFRFLIVHSSLIVLVKTWQIYEAN